MADERRMYLLRHAKSSWDDPQLADHDRPLAPRGRRAATRMGGYLREEGIHPALVLCSSARRARETQRRAAVGDDVRVEEGLYGASAQELLARLRRVPRGVESVMLIGHNPGMQDLALSLGRGGGAIDEIGVKFPTGALATLVFV